MAVPTPTPSSPPSTLTPTQTRALLHALLSTTPNAPRPTSRPAIVKVVRQQPVHQNITIDASTRIMGHCNNVTLASPSSAEQAATVKETFNGILQPNGQGEETATAKANLNLNVIIYAGLNMVGSKNVVVLNGKREVSKDDVKVDTPLAEGKRRAESEPADSPTMVAKKVKVEE